jgi:hypothetical protein
MYIDTLLRTGITGVTYLVGALLTPTTTYVHQPIMRHLSPIPVLCPYGLVPGPHYYIKWDLLYVTYTLSTSSTYVLALKAPDRCQSPVTHIRLISF